MGLFDDLSSRFVLPALIPHAVVNHDVTRHLSDKQWLPVVLTSAHDHSETSLSARVARSAINLDAWHEEKEVPFIRARLGSLVRELHTFPPDLFDAMWAADALRAHLESSVDYEACLATTEAVFASVSSPFSKGQTVDVAAFVRDAVAWLRAAPARRPIDLPRLNVATVRYDGYGYANHYKHQAAVLPLLAPTVSSIVATCITVDNLAEMLLTLPSVRHLSAPSSVLDVIISRIRNATGPGGYTALARRLTFVGGTVDAQDLAVSSHAFPNLVAVPCAQLLNGNDAYFQCLEKLEVNVPSRDPKGPNQVDCDAVARVLSNVGRTLRVLTLGAVEKPATLCTIVEAVQHSCTALRALHVDSVTDPHIFGCIAALSELRELWVKDVQCRVSDAELSAIPAALPRLETLHMSRWGTSSVPGKFVAALAANVSLLEWRAEVVSFESETASHWAARDPTRPIFPRLRKAMVPVGVAAVVARAPNLRMLSLTPGNLCDLRSVKFASPYVHCVFTMMSARQCTMLVMLLAAMEVLRESGLCAASFPSSTSSGNWGTEVPVGPARLPLTLRHLSVPAGVSELDGLLEAARATTPQGSALESLTLVYPPQSCAAITTLQGGEFPEMQRLTVDWASTLWLEAADQLRSLCDDVVVSRERCSTDAWDSVTP